jgi:hypothetical protein
MLDKRILGFIVRASYVYGRFRHRHESYTAATMIIADLQELKYLFRLFQLYGTGQLPKPQCYFALGFFLFYFHWWINRFI